MKDIVFQFCRMFLGFVLCNISSWSDVGFYIFAKKILCGYHAWQRVPIILASGPWKPEGQNARAILSHIGRPCVKNQNNQLHKQYTQRLARWQSTCLIAQGRGLHSYYTEQMAAEATPITLPPKPWDVSLCIADNVAVDHLTKVAPAEFATPQLCFSLHDQWDPCGSLCSSPGSHHTPVHWFLVSFGYSGLRWLLL